MALQDILKSVTNVTPWRRGWQDLCHDVLRLKNEATMLKVAAVVLDRYDGFDEAERLTFFRFLLEAFRADHDAIEAAISNFRNDPGPESVQALNRASLPARRQLFEVFNMVPEGTVRLVRMRSHLLGLLKAQPDLKPVDDDLAVLFSAWFNRGFLSLERISWQTTAAVLEKLIDYEAVHEIRGWDDLKRRLSDGRRCYAFFHPALPGEPIIFVQAALTRGLAGSIDQLIREEDHPSTRTDEEDADTAIFYSISNCQPGLTGIAFGDLLIKQVVDLISSELPQVKTFATLSPVPGFCRWLATARKTGALSEAESLAANRAIARADEFPWADDESVQPTLMALCAHYLVNEKRGDVPLDSVARFHLRNGAHLERVNWAGDSSAKGLAQSAGMLVNYVYNRRSVTRNHERYVFEDDVVASSAITQLTRKRT